MTEANVTAPRGEEFSYVARTKLPAATIKRLTRVSDARSALTMAQTLGSIAALGAVVWLWPYWPLWLAAAIVMAGQQHALAILAHEAVHYRLFNDRRLNDAVGRLCGWMVSVSMLSYRIIHRLHHNHLYGPLDPDMPLQAGYPRGRAYLIKRLIKDAAGLTTARNYAYFYGRPGTNSRSASDDVRSKAAIDDTSPRLKAAARRDNYLAVGFQATVLGVSVATGWWLEYLLVWLLPMLTVFQAVLRFRALAEHGAVPDTSDQRTATRTTLAPWWARWFLFPHHVNYHLEHHLYPSIPHYRLAECHRELEKTGALEGAEVTTLGEAVRKFFADAPPAPAAEPAVSG